MKRILRLFKRGALSKDIIVVSGLPRSGTSMMMKMLEAGGLSPLTDGEREADRDNPKGYYEFERVKKLDKGDHAWLPEARGKAVKIISALIPHLPATHSYRIILMARAMPEILASQRKMMIRRGEDPDQVGNEEMTRLFRKLTGKVEDWIQDQPHVKYLKVDYNAVLKDPTPIVSQINRFLDDSLDEAKMTAVIDPDLYRQRKG